MKELGEWFEKQNRRQERAVFLEDALLSDRYWAYGWYRMRFFLLRYVGDAVLHAIAVLLLYNLFPERAFVELVVVQATAGLLGSFWWGALEVMRGRIRELLRMGRPHLVPDEVGAWLTLTFGLAALTLGLTGAWLVWHVGIAGRAFGASQLYVLVVAFGLVTTLVVRALHSGVYAIRRVYRPLVAIVAMQLATFGTLPLLWPFLGIWSFPLAMLLSTLIAASITLHYTLRVYTFFGMRPLSLVSFRHPRLPRHLPWREFASAGLSFGLVKLDSFLVLALIGSRSASGTDPQLFALLFAMGPTIQAGFDWAQLFYFDFKRLEIRPFANLRRRYEGFLYRMAWVLGTLFWLGGSLSALAVYGTGLTAMALLLLPFFLSRSLVAFVQVRAFSAGQYRELLASGLLCLGGVMILRLVEMTDAQRLVGLSVLMLAVYAFLSLVQQWKRRDPGRAEALSFTDWLARASAVEGPTRVRTLRFEFPAPPRKGGGPVKLRAKEQEQLEESLRFRQLKVARGIARSLGRGAAVTVLDASGVAWIERGEQRSALTKEVLVGLGAGFVREILETSIERNGRAAVASAARQGLLGRELASAPVTSGDDDATGEGCAVEALKGAFAELFPEGACFEPTQPASTFFRSLSSKERRSILFDALRFSRDLRPSNLRSGFDVTALCEAGDLRLLFVLPRRTSVGRLSNWRRRVMEANLATALSAAG
ncbi:MAG: hypothetical protein JRH19_24955 [Deltaproteobacteria bacterium]|nr:hypothetical protein [Deltaproteobacteria bacterium]